jgi:uncharacterized protein (TIGR00369 family)
MDESQDLAARINDWSEHSRFNAWLGLEAGVATPGDITLHLRWREEFGQYRGFLHAGIIAALIDNACGYAAASIVGSVLTSQFAVRCLRPAVAEVFVVHARVVKPGRQQIFTAAELTGLDMDPSKPFAVGDAMLVPVAAVPSGE